MSLCSTKFLASSTLGSGVSDVLIMLCRLEKLVLGDSSDLLNDESKLPSCSHASAMEDSGVEEGTYDSSPQMSDTLASPEREPAWQDEEDINIW